MMLVLVHWTQILSWRLAFSYVHCGISHACVYVWKHNPDISIIGVHIDSLPNTGWRRHARRVCAAGAV